MRTLIILTTMTCALFVQAQEMKFAKFTSKEELIDAYGEDMVNDKLISLISINLYAAIDSRNHHEYEAIKSFTYEAFKDSPTVNVDEILDEVIEIWMEAV